MTIKLKKMTIIIDGDEDSEVIEIEGVRFSGISCSFNNGSEVEDIRFARIPYSRTNGRSMAELKVNIDFYPRDGHLLYTTKRLDKDGNEIGS